MKEHGKNNSQSEVFATIDIISANTKGEHELKIKVDSGTEGNTLLFSHILANVSEMCGPEQTTTSWHNRKKLQYLGCATDPVSHKKDPYKFNMPTGVNEGALNSS